MDPVYPGIWSKIPGYDGNSDSEEDEEETAIKATAAERLAQIIEVLGDRHVDVPWMDFAPAQKPRNLKDASSYCSSAPQQRLWGPNGPPPCFKVEHTDAVIVRETFLANGLVPTSERDWLVQWSGPGMKEFAYQGLHEYQRVNHFPGSTELTRKDRMWRHLLEKSKQFGKGTFDFVPETFVLPEQLEHFLDCYENSDHLWIVKPHASSRGRGIFLLRDTSELPMDELSVVSRYVENPLLIQGLKFDLRVYVLVTGFEPLRAYVYREGLTRFASSPYSTDDEHLQDAYRHLTNYSINKGARNFVENQEVKQDNVGHKWSLGALLKHLTCVGVDVELMWARIHDLILKTLLAVEPTISNKAKEVGVHPTNCFEVYGFDVLVDEDLKPWLIEVNLSPSMQAESPLDWQVKSALLADVFNLVGVSHVDNQMISTSRLRNRLLQARDIIPPMPHPLLCRSSSMSTLRPGSACSKKAQRPGDRSAADILNAAAQAVEPLLKGVNIDQLNEWQLKMLAHTLRETGRRHNFIRLYPTKATVRRYAPLVDARLMPSRFRDTRFPSSPDHGRGSGTQLSASQLLASFLFGPKPVRTMQQQARSRSRGSISIPQRRGSSNTSGTHSRTEANLMSQDGETPSAVGSTAEPETDASQTERPGTGKKALGAKSGQRLLFMEYLVRVSSTCESLNRSEKEKISQMPSYARLQSFYRQIKQRQRAQQEQEDPDPVTDSEKEEVEPGGADLIDDLASLCRRTLESLTKDVWNAEASARERDAQPKDLEQFEDLTTESLVPPTFAASLLGKKIIAGLVCLSASDLERFLAGPQCTAEFRLDLRTDQEKANEAQPSFIHVDGQWREVPNKRRPCSSGPGGRRGRQDRRQTQSGPLHDLLRVPRDVIEPANTHDSSAAIAPGRLRRSPSPEWPAPLSQHRTSPSPEGLPSQNFQQPAVSKSPREPAGTSSGGPSNEMPSAPPRSEHKTRETSAVLRPKSASMRLLKQRQHPSEAPMTPAERATAVLARSVAAQATKVDPPLKLPLQHARSAGALPDLMADALTPLRMRSSQSLKMKTSGAPRGASPLRMMRPLPAPGCGLNSRAAQGSFTHAPNFNMNMDIEL